MVRLDSCPSVMDESMIASAGFMSECDGRIDGCCIRLMMDQCWVTWSRVGTTCIVSAFVFAWNCNMLGCLPVL